MFRYDDVTVPHVVTPLPGPRAQEFLERDQRFVSPSYTRVYPLVVERGSGCVIEDVDGNLFLDFTAGIAVTNTGHCHPEVVAAIQDQASKLMHMSGTDFYYEPQIELAERLAQVAPGPSAKRVFFTNSGAESIEAALKLARYATGRSRVISFFGSFHGRTYGAMSLSGSKLVHRRGFSPLVPDIHHVPYPRSAPLPVGEVSVPMKNCKTGYGDCLRELEETVLHRTAPPDEVAAIFIEVVQGEGGYHVAPLTFITQLRALCDKHGILLVVDEVQSGMGRTGKMFAVEHYGIEPDIICLAKGIASGMPLGAIIAKSSVMVWPPGSHASTFGGNPVSCRAALATLDLLEREYLSNTVERGKQLREGLISIQRDSGWVTDVRGFGLMQAMELATVELREQVIEIAFHQGLLLLPCSERAVRFCPPLCVTADQIDTGLNILNVVLHEVLHEVAAV